AGAEIGDERIGMFLEPNLLQELERAAERLIPVDDAAFCGLMAKEDVLGDGQERDQRQLLMDDDDAGSLAVGDGAELALRSLEPDLPVISPVRIDAGKHLHEG